MALVMKALQKTLLPPPPGHAAQRSDGQQKARGASPLPNMSWEEMITCRICESPYNPDADGKRLPRDLGCGHVFCQRCLMDCVSGTGKKTYIVCPLCKKKNQLGGNSVMELPVNRQILGIVRKNQRTDKYDGQGARGSGRPGDLADEFGGLKMNNGGSNGDKCGKGCSCKKSSEGKQLVLKSALKKPKSGDGIENRRHQSGAGASKVSAGGDILSRHCEQTSAYGQENQKYQQAAEMSGYGYDGTEDGGEVDFIASLTDMLHMQPTSAVYVSSFGRYNEERASPGDLNRPTKISCSKENKILIVDSGHESVQAFSTEGHCLANFSVPEASGGCFLDETSLGVSSPRGIEVYRFSGRLLLTVPMSSIIAVARYTDGGFVAAQPTRISIGTNPTSKVRLHTISAVRQAGGDSGPKRSFIDISDVAVGGSGEIVVLDYRSVIVLDREGNLQAMIDPTNLLVASPSPQLEAEASDLFIPYAIAVDPLSGQITVSDSENRYISTFAVPGGGFVRCLVNLRDQVENDDIRAYGVAINSVGQLFVVLRAPGLAEVAIYNI